MDLYSDMPLESSKSSKDESTQSATSGHMPAKRPVKKSHLFSSLPSASIDLFGDLPGPTTGNGNNPRPAVSEKRRHDQESNNLLEPPLKTANIGVYGLRGFCAERQGEREDMQDAHTIIDNFLPDISKPDASISRLAFYAVYDGHGGSRASTFAAKHLHTNLALMFPKGDLAKVELDIKKCFVEGYKKTDEEFLKEATRRKPSWKDGSKATSILVINNTCYIANIGDSKAILCRYNESSKKHVGIPLSKDHNPTDYEERMRIQKAGGSVREGRVMGVLEVSRSLGDGPYKKHGVTSMPDLKRCTLTPNDRYLLLACDGLWKTFNTDSAIQTVNEILEDESISGAEDKSPEDVRFEQACQRLASEAVRKLSADNVTVILIRIIQKR